MRMSLTPVFLALVFSSGCHHCARQAQSPLVTVRKKINLGATRVVCYEVQYRDGTTDSDTFMDFEAFGNMNRVICRRNEKQIVLYFNYRGGTIHPPSRPKASRSMNRYFKKIYARAMREIDFKSLEWRDSTHEALLPYTSNDTIPTVRKLDHATKKRLSEKGTFPIPRLKKMKINRALSRQHGLSG